MNDREQTLVQYALLLALCGEDGQRVRDFETTHAGNMDLWPSMVETVMLYRQEKEKE